MSAVREFFAGVGTLARGFGFWRVRPGLMWLGLVPAVIVGAVIVAAVVVLVVFLEPLTLALTWFAADWGSWRDILRVLLGVALVIGVLFLAARTFTAVTLLVGAPFYDRIQQAADDAQGEVAEATPPAFWASVGATLVLILQSIGVSVIVVLIGLVPAVGSALAAVAGFALTAWGLSRELTFTPLVRRGLDRVQRSRVRGARRARTFGFGLAVQLCFLVPLGAVVVMPAAVAGSAFLARDLLAARPASASSPSRAGEPPAGASRAR